MPSRIRDPTFTSVTGYKFLTSFKGKVKIKIKNVAVQIKLKGPQKKMLVKCRFSDR